MNPNAITTSTFATIGTSPMRGISNPHCSDKCVIRITLDAKYSRKQARGPGQGLPRAFVGRWPDPSLDHLGCG